MTKSFQPSLTAKCLGAFLVCFVMGLSHELKAQAFPDRIAGTWEGMMILYKDGSARDSVRIRFTVAKGVAPGTWSWKTEYLSKTLPMTKDYTLKVRDADKQTFVTDEGNGIELQDHLFGDKLYCVFETHDVLLTSSYELRGEALIFEVTSGKKLPGGAEVINYSMPNLQRAVLRRAH